MQCNHPMSQLLKNHSKKQVTNLHRKETYRPFMPCEVSNKRTFTSIGVGTKRRKKVKTIRNFQTSKFVCELITLSKQVSLPYT